MVYKERRTTDGPMRVIMQNNEQYVTPYDQSTNSISLSTQNAILFDPPMTLTSGMKYKCVVREYLPTKYHLYTEYNIPC